MPIFEFECRSCGHSFEQLIIHSTTAECPSCHGRDLERLVSMFAVDSDGTRTAARRDGQRRSAQLTRDHNDAEIALYRREGFEIVGTRKRYYQPSGADAYTMCRPDRREERKP